MRIAAPTSPLFNPLITNADVVCDELGWSIQYASGDECSTMLLNNSVDVALLSPLGYGKGVGRLDYRIIPNPCVALVDYTAVAGISFNEQASEIGSIGSSLPKEFFAVIGSLLMREKFEADDTPVVLAGDFSNVDCLIEEYSAHPSFSPSNVTLDVSEEWFDLIELPLPVGLWVCRADADLKKIEDGIRDMASASLNTVSVHESVPIETDQFPRDGQIIYKWSDDVELGLESVLRLLYYYQILRELPAIKLLGRD